MPVVWTLSQLEIARDATVESGQANLDALWPYWIASGIAWIALTGVWFHLRRTDQRLDHDDDTPSASARQLRTSALTILLIAASARLVTIVTHRPALSDDLYRYIYDGENLAHGVNPYLPVPATSMQTFDPSNPFVVREQAWPGERDTARHINNAELTTIYLPMSQWTFGGIAMTTRDAQWNLVREERLFRAAFVVIDLVIIGLLIVLLARNGRSLWWSVLYAWHPLPIAEIAGSGHQDVIGIALLLVALLAWHENARLIIRWTIPLALAVLVKPVALPMALLLLKGRGWRAWMTSGITGALTCLIVAAPLWFTQGGEPLNALRDTSTRFSLKWAHFGSVYEPTLWMIEKATNTPEEYWAADDPASLWSNDRQEQLARIICLGLIALVILIVWRSRLTPFDGARVILLAMVLFSSTAHPWYLLWALALAPVAMSPAVWIASLTISWGYVQLGDVVEWTTPPWVLWCAYVPVYLALAIDLGPRLIRRRVDV